MSGRHLLVTNDFPPKVGGIQSYLWELWRRLDPDSFAVLTTPFAGAADFDAQQPFRVERTRDTVLVPRRALARRIDELAGEIDADVVLLDPALPLGLIGPRLSRPYGLILHGAEITVPSRIPGTNLALRRVLRGASRVIAAGGYPLRVAEVAAGRSLPAAVVPPGVDVGRFRPLTEAERVGARARLGLPADQPIIVSVSRLVPRKGMDVLVRAAAALASDHPDLVVAIAGSGRDRARLDRLVEATGAPVRFLGRVPAGDLPALYGCADVFAMLCRTRWLGLEQEGFGIVFLEAGAAGVPAVAGASGGAAEAVVDRETGLVVATPESASAVTASLGGLLGDGGWARELGAAARDRAVREYSYDVLAPRLAAAVGAAP